MLFLLACGGQPAETPARMLSPTEYRNVTRDLIGIPYAGGLEDEEIDLEALLPPELGVQGFEGFVEGQVPSNYTVESLQRRSLELAAIALESETFLVCEELEDCHAASVERFAHRAFRRPLSEDELSRLQAFHEDNVGNLGVEQGTQLTLSGLLQSPQFLFTPAFGEGPVDDWEVATRLSLFLWDSMPDPELFQAASDGRLHTRAQVRRQAWRMLEDPRAQDMVASFHSQWLEVEEVYTANADMETYGQAHGVGTTGWESEQDREEAWSINQIGFHRGMELEAEHLVREVVFDKQGTLGDLLTTNQGYLTRVADFDEWGAPSTETVYGAVQSRSGETHHYSFDDGNIGFDIQIVPVTWPASERAGLLTSGAVLKARSHPIHPAPILRGTFVYERLLCLPLGQPDETALDAAPPDSLQAEGTNRQRLEAITAVQPCSGCHDAFNGLGFAFEGYDSMGAYRTEDNGQPVDSSGSVWIDGQEVAFADGVELAHALAASEQVHDCYASWWIRYALGRMETAGDDFEPLQADFREHGRVQDLLVDIASSELFLGGAE